MTRLLVLLLIVCMSVRLDAQPLSGNKGWDYTAAFVPREAMDRVDFANPLSPTLQFRGRFSTMVLLGEPVVNCTASWLNNAGALLVPMPGRDTNSLRSEQVRAGEVEIYKLVVVAQQPHPRDRARTIAIPCDAGLVAQNGRDGFNVASSPNWNRTLCLLSPSYSGAYDPKRNPNEQDDCKAMGGNWMEADAAKQLFRELHFTQFEILRAELNESAVIRRLEKQAWREQSANFKRERTSALLKQLPGSQALQLSSSLPPLPENNPSAKQLVDYEAAWQGLLQKLLSEPTLEMELDPWRKRERELVSRQLDHIEKIRQQVKAADQQLASYQDALKDRHERAPKIPDLLAEFRPAKSAVFEERLATFKRKCGVRRADGEVIYVVEGSYCSAKQLQEGIGLYWIRSEKIPSGERSFKRYGDLIDDRGRKIIDSYRTDSLARVLPEFEELGLIWFETGLYSLEGKRFLFKSLSELGMASVQPWAGVGVLVKRDGRLAVTINNNGDRLLKLVCPYRSKTVGYYFLDSGRLEDESCENYDEDPRNVVLK